MAETQTATPATAAPTEAVPETAATTETPTIVEPEAPAAAANTETTPAPAPAPTFVAPQFPGDNILPDADSVFDQRKTINAPAEDVWPWLVQWGKGRGGWYVPSKIEKALPEKYRSAPTIDPKWQDLKVGDKVPDYGLGKKSSKKGDAAAEYHLEVAMIENQRALVYKGVRIGQDFTWALLLESPSGAATTTGSSGDSTASAPECVLHLRFRGKSHQTGWKAKVTQQVSKVADGMMAAALFPGIADRVTLQQKKVAVAV